MPEEQSVSNSPSTNLLDKNVPNPLAKNPKVHTHKVFASVGLILIGVVIATAGILGYIANQGGFDSEEKSDTSTKVSTSSASPAASSDTQTVTKDETDDWKTYDSGKTLSFKYPPTWQISTFGEGNPDGSVYIVTASELKIEECRGSTTCQSFDVTASTGETSTQEYTFISNLTVGQKTEKQGVSTIYQEFYTLKKSKTIDGVEFLSYQVDREGKTDPKQSHYLLGKKGDSYYYLSTTNEDLLNKLAATFKFL